MQTHINISAVDFSTLMRCKRSVPTCWWDRLWQGGNKAEPNSRRHGAQIRHIQLMYHCTWPLTRLQNAELHVTAVINTVPRCWFTLAVASPHWCVADVQTSKNKQTLLHSNIHLLFILFTFYWFFQEIWSEYFRRDIGWVWKIKKFRFSLIISGNSYSFDIQSACLYPRLHVKQLTSQKQKDDLLKHLCQHSPSELLDWFIHWSKSKLWIPHVVLSLYLPCYCQNRATN